MTTKCEVCGNENYYSSATKSVTDGGLMDRYAEVMCCYHCYFSSNTAKIETFTRKLNEAKAKISASYEAAIINGDEQTKHRIFHHWLQNEFDDIKAFETYLGFQLQPKFREWLIEPYSCQCESCKAVLSKMLTKYHDLYRKLKFTHFDDPHGINA